MTIYELAKELNMTPSMISRAFSPNGKISESKRKIILTAAKKYDFTPNKFASRLSMQNVRIGIVINSKFSINTEKMIAGIKNAYSKLKDYKILYEITVMNPSVNTPEEYEAVLKKYQNLNGVILTGMSSEKYTNLIRNLHEFNPNVVQVQAINKSADFLFASKHSEETASNLAAEFLDNCLRISERKNILLFTGDQESALHSSAKVSFYNACEKNRLHIIDNIDMKDDEAYFSKIIPEVFEKYGDKTDGIYITSGFSEPLCRYMEENKIYMPFVSFDTYDTIRTYIEKGIISATISQNVENQMETAFEMLVKHLITGEKCDKIIYTDVQLVLKSNIHQFR